MTVLETIMPSRKLPPRQRQIAVLIAQGKTNRQIAEELGIAKGTVEAHRGELYSRLDIHGIAELTAYVYDQGWLRLPGPGRPRKERED